MSPETTPPASGDSLRPEAILQGFRPGLVGREIVYFDTVDSTNKVLRQAALRGAAEGTVVVADEQTAGKGRLNRSWHSPPGVGVFLSVLLRPTGSSRHMHLFTFMAAVAGARAIRHVSGLPVFIHWPNDLMLRGHVHPLRHQAAPVTPWSPFRRFDVKRRSWCAKRGWRI